VKIFIGALLLLLTVGSVRVEAAEKQLCVVCALNGETELEKVAATRDYQGTTWYFCSEKCAEAFDLEPAAYVFSPGPAPLVSFVGIDGDSVRITGAPATLVDFWATWCKPCVKSMPELDAIYRAYQSQGIAVVGVAIDTGKNRQKNVRKFVEKTGVTYPVVVDREEDAGWETFRVKVLPTVFLIDRHGTIVKRWTGVVDMDDVSTSVQALLESQVVGETE
jgi:thiol-disulfide isomerase/thioredoxin